MNRHDADDPPVAAKLQRFESDFRKRRYINPIIIITGNTGKHAMKEASRSSIVSHSIDCITFTSTDHNLSHFTLILFLHFSFSCTNKGRKEVSTEAWGHWSCNTDL